MTHIKHRTKRSIYQLHGHAQGRRRRGGGRGGRGGQDPRTFENHGVNSRRVLRDSDSGPQQLNDRMVAIVK